MKNNNVVVIIGYNHKYFSSTYYHLPFFIGGILQFFCIIVLRFQTSSIFSLGYILLIEGCGATWNNW